MQPRGFDQPTTIIVVAIRVRVRRVVAVWHPRVWGTVVPIAAAETAQTAFLRHCTFL